MKLIDLRCSSCGAMMQVNPDLKKVVCNYCGSELLIDDESKKIEIANSYEYGYEAENIFSLCAFVLFVCIILELKDFLVIRG